MAVVLEPRGLVVLLGFVPGELSGKKGPDTHNSLPQL